MGNDIVLGADGTVYVTETRGGGILRLRPGETAFSTLYRDPQLAAPSGLGGRRDRAARRPADGSRQFRHR